MEAAASDLNSYYKATEWAMLHFHKEKMREINAMIRELWRQIYRGSDIDYIEIKTDVPEHSCKFYNYCTCNSWARSGQCNNSNPISQNSFLYYFPTIPRVL